MSKKKDDFHEKPTKSADGHVLVEGSRWHYPKAGSPSVCAITGCTRELGLTPVIELEPEDEPDDTTTEPADATDESTDAEDAA